MYWRILCFFMKLSAIGLVCIAMLWLALARPFVFFPEDKQINAEVRSSVLEGHVRKLAEEFVPRDWKHPETLAKVASYIADEFRNANSRVSFQRFEVRGQEYLNVISEYGFFSLCVFNFVKSF